MGYPTYRTELTTTTPILNVCKDCSHTQTR